MSVQVSEEDLADEFSVFSVELEDPDVIQKLQEICLMHRLDAGQLVTEWVAFTHSKKNQALSLNFDTLQQFERERLSKRTQKTSKPPKDTTPVIHNISNLPIDVEGAEELYTAYGGSTPNSKVSSKRQHTPENAAMKRFAGGDRISRSPAMPFSPASFSPASTTPAKRYTSRTNRGEVVCSLGSTNNMKWQGSGQPVSVGNYCSEQTLSSDMKYMFQKLAAKRDVLNDIIEDMAEQLQRAHNIDEYSHVALPTQEEVTVVGRVCCDSNGKLNKESVLLEGSIDMSSGKMIPVELSRLKEFALFPGQIVAMSGHNSTGQKFVASKLFESVTLPLPEVNVNVDNSTTKLSVMIAAGPFSTSDSLSYEPLTDLLEQIQQTKPDVCILMGPFIDSKNTEIENGKLTSSFEDFFSRTLTGIAQATENLNVQLVILPSYRDLHHDPVYPTPPFSKKNFKSFEHVHFYADPCTLRINNIVLGLTSTDVLFHLGTEEILHPPGSSDRLGRLTQHLLNQHSYYPYYPPSDEMCIDYEKFHTACLMPTTPHILVVPSEFKQFIKEIKGCCCINPGRLTKGLTGSTFARLVIQMNSLSSNQSVVKDVTAQVVRI